MAAQREWYEKDYYKVLGVSDTAPEKAVIARFFRELARELGLEVDILGADWANRDRVCDAQGPGRNQVRGIGRGKLRRLSVPGA